jgi:nitroreductase
LPQKRLSCDAALAYGPAAPARSTEISMSESSPNLNIAVPQTLDLLLSRRSGSAKAMKGPGPDSDQLRRILTAGVRVPDHGKLTPWRFILFEGEGRARMGAILGETIAGERESSPERIEQERGRFLRAPVVVGVVSRAREQIPIPLWEQELSAGAVCMTIVIAAHALGFQANWITEWCAYHPKVLERIGLKPAERIAGYIYIGHAADPLEDRPRPPADSITTRF